MKLTMTQGSTARVRTTLVALLLTTSAAQGQPPGSTFVALPTDQLERLYLECADRSMKVVLDPGTAAHCSLAADVLRDRRFAGSLEQMLVWWHGTRPPLASAAGGENLAGGAQDTDPR